MVHLQYHLFISYANINNLSSPLFVYCLALPYITCGEPLKPWEKT